MKEIRLQLLEEIFKEQKPQYSADLKLRIQRAFSWFNKANSLDQELDLQFLSFWICLNALYQQGTQQSDNTQCLNAFLTTIVIKDQYRKIETFISGQYRQRVISLLENKYLTQSYWDYQNQIIRLDACQQQLQQDHSDIRAAIEQRNITKILHLLFARLYMLNKQIINGGSSYQSDMNRKPLNESCTLLNRLLPIFMLIVLENTDIICFPKPYYPMQQFS